MGFEKRTAKGAAVVRDGSLMPGMWRGITLAISCASAKDLCKALEPSIRACHLFVKREEVPEATVHLQADGTRGGNRSPEMRKLQREQGLVY